MIGRQKSHKHRIEKIQEETEQGNESCIEDPIYLRLKNTVRDDLQAMAKIILELPLRAYHAA